MRNAGPQAVARPLSQQLLAYQLFGYAQQLGPFRLARVEMSLHNNLVPVFDEPLQNSMTSINTYVRSFGYIFYGHNGKAEVANTAITPEDDSQIVTNIKNAFGVQ